jgi:hypothetical protein
VLPEGMLFAVNRRGAPDWRADSPPPPAGVRGQRRGADAPCVVLSGPRYLRKYHHSNKRFDQ